MCIERRLIYHIVETLQRALKDPRVQGNLKQRSQITSKRDEAIKKADGLLKAIEQEKRYAFIITP